MDETVANKQDGDSLCLEHGFVDLNYQPPGLSYFNIPIQCMNNKYSKFPRFTDNRQSGQCCMSCEFIIEWTLYNELFTNAVKPHRTADAWRTRTQIQKTHTSSTITAILNDMATLIILCILVILTSPCATGQLLLVMPTSSHIQCKALCVYFTRCAGYRWGRGACTLNSTPHGDQTTDVFFRTDGSSHSINENVQVSVRL